MSVIIVTYNRAEILAETLKVWAEQDFKDFELIIVDDGSNDGTYDIISKLSDGLPFETRIYRQENKGPGAARNLALRYARGDIIMFVDDDAFPVRQLTLRHVYWHEKYPNAVVRGPVINFSNLEDLQLRPPRTLIEKLKAFSRNYFCTANVSIRKDYLEEVGGFNESFRRWQDTELAYRLRYRFKLRWIFDYNATVWHYKPTDSFKPGHHYREGVFAAKLLKLYPRDFRVKLRTGYYFPNCLLWRIALLEPFDKLLSVIGFERRLEYIRGFLDELKRPEEV